MSDPAYRTIKALVLDFVHRSNGNVDYEALTKEVRAHFPDSKWKRTHWYWYRYQILHGRFRSHFSDSERVALSRGRGGTGAMRAISGPAIGAPDETPGLARGPQARDPEIKRVGDALLDHTREMITLVSGDDLDKRFKLNRWILSRLLRDEQRIKRPIKQALWSQGQRECAACREPFASLKGVELHRKDPLKNYSLDNCELICRDCHQELGQHHGHDA